jgi:hypothetical protein
MKRSGLMLMTLLLIGCGGQEAAGPFVRLAPRPLPDESYEKPPRSSVRAGILRDQAGKHDEFL